MRSGPNHPHAVLREDELTLRPSTEGDLDRLATWFADPEIYVWWGGLPLSRGNVAEKYIGRRCPDVESFVIEYESQPIGYIQYHREGPGQAGLDMMLVPEFRGRGLGPKAARILVEHLRSALGWTDITVDPASANPRAIRAWQKAGFTIHGEWPDHPDAPALLMRWQASDAASRD